MKLGTDPWGEIVGCTWFLARQMLNFIADFQIISFWVVDWERHFYWTAIFICVLFPIMPFCFIFENTYNYKQNNGFGLGEGRRGLSMNGSQISIEETSISLKLCFNKHIGELLLVKLFLTMVHLWDFIGFRILCRIPLGGSFYTEC